MDKLTEASKENETKTLMLEDDVFHDQTTQKDELTFPWALVHAVKDLNKIIQSNQNCIKNCLLSFHFQLLIVLFTCGTCILVGLIFFGDCYCHGMLSIFFIAEGVCGFCIVAIHACAINFE